ncbi:hypothetical protein SNEBB_007620 [Seison nebaliae]|nr:hypothetical protein SNEBB_007620 [Seison nebaliae]
MDSQLFECSPLVHYECQEEKKILKNENNSILRFVDNFVNSKNFIEDLISYRKKTFFKLIGINELNDIVYVNGEGLHIVRNCGDRKVVSLWGESLLSFDQIVLELFTLNWTNDNQFIVLTDNFGDVHLFDRSSKYLNKFSHSMNEGEQMNLMNSVASLHSLAPQTNEKCHLFYLTYSGLLIETSLKNNNEWNIHRLFCLPTDYVMFGTNRLDLIFHKSLQLSTSIQYVMVYLPSTFDDYQKDPHHRPIYSTNNLFMLLETTDESFQLIHSPKNKLERSWSWFSNKTSYQYVVDSKLKEKSSVFVTNKGIIAIYDYEKNEELFNLNLNRVKLSENLSISTDVQTKNLLAQLYGNSNFIYSNHPISINWWRDDENIIFLSTCNGALIFIDIDKLKKMELNVVAYEKKDDDDVIVNYDFYARNQLTDDDLRLMDTFHDRELIDLTMLRSSPNGIFLVHHFLPFSFILTQWNEMKMFNLLLKCNVIQKFKKLVPNSNRFIRLLRYLNIPFLSDFVCPPNEATVEMKCELTMKSIECIGLQQLFERKLTHKMFDEAFDLVQRYPQQLNKDILFVNIWQNLEKRKSSDINNYLFHIKDVRLLIEQCLCTIDNNLNIIGNLIDIGIEKTNFQIILTQLQLEENYRREIDIIHLELTETMEKRFGEEKFRTLLKLEKKKQLKFEKDLFELNKNWEKLKIVKKWKNISKDDIDSLNYFIEKRLKIFRYFDYFKTFLELLDDVNISIGHQLNELRKKDLFEIACQLADKGNLIQLRSIFQNHLKELSSNYFSILLHINMDRCELNELLHVIPLVEENDRIVIPKFSPHRSIPDWTEILMEMGDVERIDEKMISQWNRLDPFDLNEIYLFYVKFIRHILITNGNIDFSDQFLKCLKLYEITKNDNYRRMEETIRLMHRLTYVNYYLDDEELERRWYVVYGMNDEEELKRIQIHNILPIDLFDHLMELDRIDQFIFYLNFLEKSKNISSQISSLTYLTDILEENDFYERFFPVYLRHRFESSNSQLFETMNEILKILNYFDKFNSNRCDLLISFIFSKYHQHLTINSMNIVQMEWIPFIKRQYNHQHQIRPFHSPFFFENSVFNISSIFELLKFLDNLNFDDDILRDCSPFNMCRLMMNENDFQQFILTILQVSCEKRIINFSLIKQLNDIIVNMKKSSGFIFPFYVDWIVRNDENISEVSLSIPFMTELDLEKLKEYFVDIIHESVDVNSILKDSKTFIQILYLLNVKKKSTTNWKYVKCLIEILQSVILRYTRSMKSMVKSNKKASVLFSQYLKRLTEFSKIELFTYRIMQCPLMRNEKVQSLESLDQLTSLLLRLVNRVDKFENFLLFKKLIIVFHDLISCKSIDLNDLNLIQKIFGGNSIGKSINFSELTILINLKISVSLKWKWLFVQECQSFVELDERNYPEILIGIIKMEMVNWEQLTDDVGWMNWLKFIVLSIDISSNESMEIIDKINEKIKFEFGRVESNPLAKITNIPIIDSYRKFVRENSLKIHPETVVEQMVMNDSKCPTENIYEELRMFCINRIVELGKVEDDLGIYDIPLRNLIEYYLRVDEDNTKLDEFMRRIDDEQFIQKINDISIDINKCRQDMNYFQFTLSGLAYSKDVDQLEIALLILERFVGEHSNETEYMNDRLTDIYVGFFEFFFVNRLVDDFPSNSYQHLYLALQSYTEQFIKLNSLIDQSIYPIGKIYESSFNFLTFVSFKGILTSQMDEEIERELTRIKNVDHILSIVILLYFKWTISDNDSNESGFLHCLVRLFELNSPNRIIILRQMKKANQKIENIIFALINQFPNQLQFIDIIQLIPLIGDKILLKLTFDYMVNHEKWEEYERIFIHKYLEDNSTNWSFFINNRKFCLAAEHYFWYREPVSLFSCEMNELLMKMKIDNETRQREEKEKFLYKYIELLLEEDGSDDMRLYCTNLLHRFFTLDNQMNENNKEISNDDTNCEEIGKIDIHHQLTGQSVRFFDRWLTNKRKMNNSIN